VSAFTRRRYATLAAVLTAMTLACVLIAGLPKESVMNPKVLSRDQGRLGGLVRWGGKPVARSSPPRLLNLTDATSEPIIVPGLDVVQSVAGDSVRFAGGLVKGALTVLRERGSKWEPVPLPQKVLDAPGERGLSIFASGESLVVVWYGFDKSTKPTRYANGLEWWNGKSWVSPALQGKDGQGPPMHVLVSPARLLVGYSRGEWGGSLWSVAPSGEVSEVGPKDGLPVQSLVVTERGVLVGTGLAHLGGLEAHVGLLATDGSWTTLARVSAYDEKKTVSWDLPPDSLEGLDVDSQGRVHLFTGAHGVVRLEKGKLTQLTQGGPEHLYGEGLLLEGELAVMGTFDGGVLVCKLGTSEVRRIPIPR
jgi:hypothetical protein